MFWGKKRRKKFPTPMGPSLGVSRLGPQSPKNGLKWPINAQMGFGVAPNQVPTSLNWFWAPETITYTIWNPVGGLW